MNLRPSIVLLAACAAALSLTACGGSSLNDDGSSADDLRHRHHDGGSGHHDGGVHHDGGTPGNDAGVPPGRGCATDNDCQSGGLCSAGSCVASACDQRHSGVTGLRATVVIDRYLGLINGRNGTHEIATGTLQDVSWIYQSSLEDTTSVQLAMNVASATDPQGLPQEIPLTPGEVIEVEGEYIPAAAANARGRAVVHYTHGSCGFVEINGVIY